MVTQAAWRKYPNPLNTSVVAIDIVDRKIKEGKLHSHRLLTTRWGVPRWAQTLFGADKMGYASEHSVVDPEQKVMTMMSRNVSWASCTSNRPRIGFRDQLLKFRPSHVSHLTLEFPTDSICFSTAEFHQRARVSRETNVYRTSDGTGMYIDDAGSSCYN